MKPGRKLELQSAIDEALGPFINEEHLMPGTKASVVEMVTGQAALIIDLMCGDPDAPPPVGFMGKPLIPARNRNLCECAAHPTPHRHFKNGDSDEIDV